MGEFQIADRLTKGQARVMGEFQIADLESPPQSVLTSLRSLVHDAAYSRLMTFDFEIRLFMQASAFLCGEEGLKNMLDIFL